jgi:methylmalonyl-CoA/ethylmalonyl-CoA epimerase
MSTEFKLSQIGQIAIPVKEQERAVSFYRDTLGMHFLFDVPGLSFFDCGGIRLLLDSPAGEKLDHHSSINYFRVDDIEIAYRTLIERGVEFTESPHLIAKLSDHDLWMAFFKDPDENILALMSEVPHA